MEEQHIDISFTARYYTLGTLSPNPDQEVWVVLHGYGQLAKYFIQKFEAVVQRGGVVVAPEGLSLFYLQGTEGRIGSTWMTKEYREQSINNYIGYLQKVYQVLELHHKRLVVFSFSQGGATLIRWVVKHRVSFQKMIVWAGGFPPDVNPEVCRDLFSGKLLYYVYGDQDQYITPARMEKQQALFKQFHFQPEIIKFSGRHVVDPDVLRQLQ